MDLGWLRLGRNGGTPGRNIVLGLLFAGGAGIGFTGCESEPIHSTHSEADASTGEKSVNSGSGGDPMSAGAETTATTAAHSGATTRAPGGSTSQGGSATTQAEGSATTQGGSATTQAEGGATTQGGSATTQAEGGAAGQPTETTPDAKLDDLMVTGVEVGLKPAFRPGTTRYSVLAAEPEAALVVTATAAEDLQIFVNGVATDSGVAVPLPNVAPGSEIEVEVTNDAGDSATYDLLYLPARFPDFEVTVHEASASTDPIYLTTMSPEATFFVVKLDNSAVPIVYRQTGLRSFDFKKHSTGHVSYSELLGDPPMAEHVVFNERLIEVDRVRTVGLLDTDEHEFLIRPNGNYVVLAYEPVVRDLTEFGRGSAEPIFDGIWQELTPSREVLFQWNTWDHMSFGESVYADKRDYSHMNAAVIDDEGDWIVSSRGQSQVLKLDGTTGDVIWKLGGVDNDFAFINDPFSGLCGQHTPSILENGNLLLFDNGQHCYPEMPERGELTRVVEYAIDEAAMTAELVWSYSRDDAYTQSQGSSQRLPNGNTWIGWGRGTNLLATEVTPEGEVVYELRARSITGYTQSYRAWRFPD